jgi:hypothetical protein
MITRQHIIEKARELANVDDYDFTEEQYREQVKSLFTLVYEAYLADFSVDEVVALMEEAGKDPV